MARRLPGGAVDAHAARPSGLDRFDHLRGVAMQVLGAAAVPKSNEDRLQVAAEREQGQPRRAGPDQRLRRQIGSKRWKHRRQQGRHQRADAEEEHDEPGEQELDTDQHDAGDSPERVVHGAEP